MSGTVSPHDLDPRPGSVSAPGLQGNVGNSAGAPAAPPAAGLLGLRRDASDVERLLHELQVHQIELEMQNTELRRTQVELELSRNKFSNLYDFSPIGYFSIGRDTTILEVNLHGSLLVDVPRMELSGKPFYLFVCAEFRRLFYVHVEEVFASGGPRTCEIQLQCRGNKRIWVRLDSILSNGDAANEPHCRTSVLDITQQKDAESRLATLALAVEQSPDAVVIVDAAGGCEYANSRFLGLVGVSLDRLRGLSLPSLLSQSRVFRGAQLPSGALESAEPQRFTLHLPELAHETSWIRPGAGTHAGAPASVSANAGGASLRLERWFNVSVSPVFGPHGLHASTVVSFTDDTELQTTLRALTAAKERAETASAAKSQFLANMSHELRTPLNSVLGFADLLLLDEVDATKTRWLEAIGRSGRILLNLLDDLLDLSRIEAGKLVLQENSFDPRRLVEDSRQAFELQAREKGLSFSGRVDADVPARLLGDEFRIAQILSNLVGNATKFTRQGFVAIECAWRRDKGALVVQVSDSGVGIAGDSIERVFLPFEQADSTSTREHQGSGLGLAIVRRLAEAMRGTVSLRSEIDVGTCVTVELPLAVPRVAAASEPAPARDLRLFAAGEAARLRVLLADDCPVNQKLLVELLARCGLSCDTVADGEDALLALERQSYDLLLLDMQMPRKDGFEVLRALAGETHPRGGRPWVITVTAHALKGDQERMRAAGADDYLSKPIGIAPFAEALAAFRVHWLEAHSRRAKNVLPS